MGWLLSVIPMEKALAVVMIVVGVGQLMAIANVRIVLTTDQVF